mmetsp:Transcript_34471/g.58457  ORF Transcript_34471/g.58457 Transcript_34471/m.58457 type:complete len:270 (-) Transcript_34471:8-817(-)
MRRRGGMGEHAHFAKAGRIVRPALLRRSRGGIVNLVVRPRLKVQRIPHQTDGGAGSVMHPVHVVVQPLRARDQPLVRRMTSGQKRLLRLADGPADVGLLGLAAALDAVAGAEHAEVVDFEDLDGCPRDAPEGRHGGEVDLAALRGGVFFDRVGGFGGYLAICQCFVEGNEPLARPTRRRHRFLEGLGFIVGGGRRKLGLDSLVIFLVRGGWRCFQFQRRSAVVIGGGGGGGGVVMGRLGRSGRRDVRRSRRAGHVFCFLHSTFEELKRK